MKRKRPRFTELPVHERRFEKGVRWKDEDILEILTTVAEMPWGIQREYLKRIRYRQGGHLSTSHLHYWRRRYGRSGEKLAAKLKAND